MTNLDRNTGRLREVLTQGRTDSPPSVGAALTVSMVKLLVNRFIVGQEMTLQPPGGEFLLFLVVAVILVPVQSGFEEVFLRGYLLQGLMQFLRNKVVPAILTGVIFALPHLANPEPRSIAICCSPTSWSTC